MNKDIEKNKVRNLLKEAQGPGMRPPGGMGGKGPSPAASPFMSQPPIMTAGQPPMGGPMGGAPPGGGRGAPKPPATPAPAMPPAASIPAGDPAAGAPPTKPQASPAGPEASNREDEVRAAIQSMKGAVVEVAKTIYQIPLTEEQVSDISSRLIQTLSDSVNDITVDRVKEIAHDLIGEVVPKRRRK